MEVVGHSDTGPPPLTLRSSAESVADICGHCMVAFLLRSGPLATAQCLQETGVSDRPHPNSRVRGGPGGMQSTGARTLLATMLPSAFHHETTGVYGSHEQHFSGTLAEGYWRHLAKIGIWTPS